MAFYWVAARQEQEPQQTEPQTIHYQIIITSPHIAHHDTAYQNELSIRIFARGIACRHGPVGCRILLPQIAQILDQTGM